VVEHARKTASGHAVATKELERMRHFTLALTAALGLSGCSALDLAGSSRAGALSEGDAVEANLGDEGVAARTCRCRFTTYNLEVEVGDTFVLANFLSCGKDRGALRFVADGDTLDLAALNADAPITISAGDAQSGNHGEGRHRIELVDESGDVVDKVTIRVDDKSEIGAGAADAPAGCPVGDDDGNVDDDGDDDGHHGGGHDEDDDDGDDDDDGAGNDDPPGDDNGAGNDDPPGDDNGAGNDDPPGDDDGNDAPPPPNNDGLN
jgi:hypothetical protein